ncbi:MAG: type II secretion system major pseudopilin GspG [Hyphomonas sp.]|nr:type II secretion system major pseudopilin GspG [Hyphomonas sp.]
MKLNISRKNKPRREEGFSLIELMVVVLIMGLLATTIVLTLAPVGEQSRATKARADVASLESALEMYNLDMSQYPTADRGLEALLATAGGSSTAGFRPGGYVKRLRKDPWGNDYHYVVPGARSVSAFDVFSAGPDGQAGNEDDIGNWN